MAKKTSKQTALLIDANALIHRAWHALPPLTSPDGRIVNAVYGFSSVLMKVLASERPTFVATCWDTPEPTYRHTAKPEYKAHREEQPDEFYAQIPLVKDAVHAFGVTNIELPGYEADDLLATYATVLAKKGVEVTILTSDRDVWQLISPNIRIMVFKKGVTETAIIDRAALQQEMGLTPEQVTAYKALRGDASDNLKGVTGIGEKTATDLLQSFKTFEGIFKAAHDPKSKMTDNIRKKLIDGEKDARETLPLVELIKDAPSKEKADDLMRRPVDEEALRKLFVELGFKTLLSRAFGSKDSISTPIPTKATKTTKTDVVAMKENVATSTVEDILALVKDAEQEGAVIIRPITVLQGSLFADAPSLALRTEGRVAGISTTQIKEKRVAAVLAKLLADDAVKKNGHGLKETWHWAHAHGFAIAGVGFDTELASYLLTAGEGDHDLDALAASYLQLSIPEGDEHAIVETKAIQLLMPKLQARLKEESLDRFLDRFEMPLIPILTGMEERGILVDRAYLKTVAEDFRAEKARLEKEMESLAGEPFNPASPQQLARILFDVLKISTKGIKRGKTGISTAASELEKLEGMHPIITKVGEYREVAKLLSTYVEAIPLLADTEGRVHTTYNQALTATGRLSSSNPNLQNIPIRTELGRKIRRAFVAKPGYRLLSCDYSQVELRVIAALAKDDRMLDAFRRGLDIHTATAAAIWNVPLEQVTKDQRRAAKTINFGIMYGQGPMALSKGAGISFEDAKKFIAEYFRIYSGIKTFLDETKALAHSRGYVETLFGRRRYIKDINSPLPQFRAGAERMAINMPVQGTSADLIKLAMQKIAQVLPTVSPDSAMLLQVHDELVFEVPENDVKRVAEAVVDIMQTIEKIGAPIVVDAKVGKNWDEMEGV